MNKESSPAGKNGRERNELPPIGKCVVVEANGCRCMAFRDPDGKWREYFCGDELRGYIKVIQPD